MSESIDKMKEQLIRYKLVNTRTGETLSPEHYYAALEIFPDGSWVGPNGETSPGWRLEFVGERPKKKTPDTCRHCDGDGYTIDFSDGPNRLDFEDCIVCKGAGKL